MDTAKKKSGRPDSLSRKWKKSAKLNTNRKRRQLSKKEISAIRLKQDLNAVALRKRRESSGTL